jgi:hypothetical protein
LIGPISSIRQPLQRLLHNRGNGSIRFEYVAVSSGHGTRRTVSDPERLCITSLPALSITQPARSFPQVFAAFRLSNNPNSSIAPPRARLLNNYTFVYCPTQSAGEPRKHWLLAGLTRARVFNFFFLTSLTRHRLQGLRPAGSCLRQPDPAGLPPGAPGLRPLPSAFTQHEAPKGGAMAPQNTLSGLIALLVALQLNNLTPAVSQGVRGG